MTELALAPALLLPALVLWPALVGLALLLLPPAASRSAHAFGFAVQAALLLAALTAPQPLSAALGGWAAPLGIGLAGDAPALALLLLCACVYGAVLLYASAYFGPRCSADPRLWLRFGQLAWLLWAGLNAAALGQDAFNLFVALELVGLAAVGLTALSGLPTALSAALRYLLAALLASNLFLLGVVLLYAGSGALALPLIGAHLALLVHAPPYALLALALLVLALLIKAAVAPLHFWLPAAHGGAAAPVSALLSALVIKVALLLLWRLWLHLGAAIDLALAGLLLALLGALATLWGSVLALTQRKLKMLIAYSSVAQVGLLLLPLAWLLPGSAAAPLALEGGLLHLLAHGLAKAAFFLAAGVLLLSAGRDDLASLRGAVARQPLAFTALALAGFSLVGLPPSLGFAAKWQFMQAALLAGQWPWVVWLLLATLLSAAYVLRVLRLAFLPDPQAFDPAAAHLPQSLPLRLSWTALGLAALAAFGGLGSAALSAWFDLANWLPTHPGWSA